MIDVTNTRKNWIDMCRGLGILLVLLGHNNPPFIRFIFGFHMPLFFILSGYLYKDSDTSGAFKAYFLKIVRRYFVPYIILSFMNLVLHILNIAFVTKTFSSVPAYDIIRWLIGIITVDRANMPGCGQLWFLPSLAISLLVFRLIKKIPNAYVQVLLFILLAILTRFLSEKNLFFSLYTIPIAVIFIEIGYLINHHSLISMLISPTKSKSAAFKGVIYMLLLLILGYVCIRFNNANPWVDISNARFGIVPITLIGGTSFSLAIMLAFYIFEQYICINIKGLGYIGKHTLFFLGFDGASNAWGGTFITLYNIPISMEWYSVFIYRILIIGIMFTVWQLLIKMIPSTKVKNILNF